MSENGNGRNGNGTLAAIRRATTQVAVGVTIAVLVSIGAMAMGVRDDMAAMRSTLAVTSALAERRLVELERRMAVVEERIERLHGR